MKKMTKKKENKEIKESKPQTEANRTFPWSYDEYIIVNGIKLVYSYRRGKIYVHPIGINKEPVILDNLIGHNKIIMPKHVRKKENNNIPLPIQERKLGYAQSI